MFVGREYELNFLNKRYNSKKAELVILYGRRRVGKTELLTEFCKDKPHVFYTCNEYTNSKQLQEFSQKFLRTNHEIANFVKEFSDWESAFRFLGEYDGEKKTVVVIDEFPYMVKGDASIPSVLQNLWDHNLKNKNIMLILSGSSMSFIEKELLAYKKPLYGRATVTYKLEPLPYYDAVKFFPNYSDEDKALAFSILGGIPHYLCQFDGDLTLEENIKQNILQKSSQLYDEVEFLLHQEMREPAVYITILDAIALGCNKYSEISEKSGIDSSKLSTYLKNLTELGIIKKQLSVLAKTRDKIKKSQGEYVIADYFFRFYYKYMYPYKAELDTNNVELVWKHRIKNDLHNFASKPFEDMCIAYLYLLADKEKLPALFLSFGRFQEKVSLRGADGKPVATSVEIDILGEDEQGKNYLLGECKFKNELFDLSELNKLKQKATLFKGNCHFYLFALSGFTDAVKQQTENDPNLHLVTLADVLSERN